MFPATQILPSRRLRSRRDGEGIVRFNPPAIGQFHHLIPSQFFGDVPVGRFVRDILSHILIFLDTDLMACSPDDVSYFF